VNRTRGLVSPPFTVDTFTLFESRLSRHGAHYEPLVGYPLDASRART
jgi:2'-5' RNA ligase